MRAQETQIRAVGIVLAALGGLMCAVYLWGIADGFIDGHPLAWLAWAACIITATMTYSGISLYRLMPAGRNLATVILVLSVLAIPMAAPVNLLGLYLVNRRSARAILSNGYARVEPRDFSYHLHTWLFAAVILAIVAGLKYLHIILFPPTHT
jgi:hypothetical protein